MFYKNSIVVGKIRPPETRLKMGNKYVQVSWEYNRQGWHFYANPEDFVLWVQAGFGTACIDCFVVMATADPNCRHVVFRGDRGKAHRLVKAIKMGLLV